MSAFGRTAAETSQCSFQKRGWGGNDKDPQPFEGWGAEDRMSLGHIASEGQSDQGGTFRTF